MPLCGVGQSCRPQRTVGPEVTPFPATIPVLTGDMMTAYLEEAAAELRTAAARVSGAFAFPQGEAEFRLRVAAGFERLAAIEAGLPPCRCHETTAPDAETS